jgi:hypothetical protein
MLKEINRVLKPNGVLLLTTTCYSTSIFQFLNSYRGSISQFLKEVYIYIAGFRSKEKRNAFVRKWCFKSLGGHYHGFRPNILKKDINNIGMTILKKKTFYVFPPITTYNPKGLAKSAMSRKKSHSLIKRIAMLLMSFIIIIVNPVFKFFRILPNNVYILAQKN